MLWSGWPGTRAETSCLLGLRTSLHGCGMCQAAHACRHALSPDRILQAILRVIVCGFMSKFMTIPDTLLGQYSSCGPQNLIPWR